MLTENHYEFVFEYEMAFGQNKRRDNNPLFLRVIELKTITYKTNGGIKLINTLTINTAIDKLLFIDAFAKNNTNRISKTVTVLGGKGTHVSLNMSTLGVYTRSFGITQGETGKRICDILSEKGNIEVNMLHYDEGESRTNYAVIEKDKTCTLVVEKGSILAKERCEDLLDILEKTLTNEDYLVLAGDASNTEVPLFYNEVMKRLKEKGVTVFLDASGVNLIEGIKCSPFLVKPNLDELSQITNSPIETEQDILSAIDKVEKHGIGIVAVSCGADGSYVRYKGETYRVYPADVEVSNTIGCGDAFLSGLVYALHENYDFERVLQYACAVSAATAECELTVGFELDRVNELLDTIKIEKIAKA